MAQSVTTTRSLPQELADALEQAIREGRVRSRDELIAAAIRRELDALEREAIDAEIAEMANDEEFQREARQICAEFA